MDNATPSTAPPRLANPPQPTGPKTANKKPGAKAPPQRRWSMGKEISYVTFGCLGSILGTVFFLISIGFLVGSHYLEGVIKDIGATNFTKQMERIDHYTSFFDALRDNGYRVRREDPEIDKGVIYYLWQATPPGSDEARVFRWQHDLASNVVEPINNPALLLDLKLGYIKAQEAETWKFNDPGQKYDPGDNLVQAMVNNDFSMINPADLVGQNTAGAALPEGPVGAPLISPGEGRGRGGVSKEKEAEEGGEGEGKGEDTEPGGEAQPVDPGESAPPPEEAPPAEPDPGQNDDPGGETIDVQ